MHYSSDELIFSGIKNSDELALKAMFDRYFLKMVNTSYKLCADAQLAQDLTQDVFIKFWNKRDTISLHTSLSAYLHRMTINESLSYLRKHKKMDTIPMDAELRITSTPRADEKLELLELETKVSKAIEDLPEKCSIIFKLSRYENLSYKEIATELNLSIKTVENQISKALRTLRISLKNYLHAIFF
jgi:RNA polymerase sigma-70 factor (ECF subfamily)